MSGLLRRGNPVDRATAAVLAVVVGVHLWVLRHLRADVAWPNDLDFHGAMVGWASGQYRDGRIPFDGWFPTLSGGLPQFHHYQSLPHLLAGALGVPLGAGGALHLTLWLLVGSWPVAVYVGARALGLDRAAGLASAAVAPLLRSATGYGFEPFSYLWIGNGLWSQAWGMWAAPLALGWSARAVRTGERRRRAVAATALTLALHLPTGWFMLLSVGLWVLVRPGEWRVRLGRAVWIGWRSALATLWVVVPFLVDRWATNDSSFNGQGDFADSFGWRRVLGWAFAGDIVDAGRVPLLSALAVFGLALIVHRWSEARAGEREVTALFAAALVLFVGRDPFGPVIALLPGASQVFLHRYVAVLQLASVWALGVAVSQIWIWVRASAETATSRPVGPSLRVVRTVALVSLVAVPVGAAVRSTDRLLRQDRSWVSAQAEADETLGSDARALLDVARRRGGGRVFGGKLNGTLASRIGQVPMPIWLAHERVDAVGFTLRVSALSADLETYLDERSIADLDQFGVRYLLVAAGSEVPGTTSIATRGGLELRELPGDGLAFAADLVEPSVRVGNGDLAAVLLPVMRQQGWSPDAVQSVIFEDRTASGTRRVRGQGPPGGLARVDERLDRGSFQAQATFDRPGVVVVRTNYHPRWTATVDGDPAPVLMVAPTWIAVEVPAGVHDVALTYRPWSHTPLLLGVAAVAIGLPPVRIARAPRRKVRPAAS